MLLRVKLAIPQGDLHDMLSAEINRLELNLTDCGLIENPRQLTSDPVDVLIVSDENIPQPRLDTLKLVMQTPDPPSIIVLSSSERDIQTAMLATGCEAVLNLRVSPQIICRAVSSLLKKHMERQNEILNTQNLIAEPKLSDFVSKSLSMQVFLNTVKKVVNSDSSLLILGETGVGKERLALAVHGESRRKTFPFITVNCAALPENLLESELFGHEKGAFTGAIRSRRGAFELAHKGTIFLDEIGDMPLHLQTKLLRVLQEKQFLKIGGETMVKVDVRVMAATNRDLALSVKNGSFRKDLYYRLSVIGLTIPPLSERREDISELVRNYISYLAPRIGVSVNGITPEAMDVLINYGWPGNVRELINVIERAMLLCENDKIALSDLPDDITMKVTGGEPLDKMKRLESDSPDWTGSSWKSVRGRMMDLVEKKYFAAMLAKHDGKVSAAASAARISPRAFYLKLQKHSIGNTLEE